MELINSFQDMKAKAYLKVNVSKNLCASVSPPLLDRLKPKQQLFLYLSLQAHNSAVV